MKKFIGRAEQKKAFEESLLQILPDSKKGLFSKKEKKPDTPKITPRLFLFYGEGGLGKTVLMDECIRTAEEKARKNKQNIKIIKLDWDDCYNKKSLLPENISSITKELFAGFSGALPEPEKYFKQFLEKKKEISASSQTKEEQPHYELIEILSKGVVELSKDYPLLLAIDAYERIDNKKVDHWFRGIFLKEILESPCRITVILSGQNNHVELYKRQFPGPILHHSFFDAMRFAIPEIKEYSRACGLKFKEKELEKLLRFTLGIPLVIVEACNLIKEGLTLNQVLGSLISTRQIRTVIQDMVKISLKYCDPKTTEHLFNIAMLHHCNPEILASAWRLSPKATSNYLLADLSGRLSFIHKGKMHPQVHEYLRHYIINELVPKNPLMFKRFGKKCRDFLEPRLDEIEKKVTNIEELYSNDNFPALFLDYINALMWWDSGEAIGAINKHFLGLLEFKREVIPRLNKILFEFDSILTPEQKKNVDTLVTGFLDEKVNGENINRTPGKSEIELLASLGNHKKVFSSMQIQLLYFKWGEIYFRSGEYEKAANMLDLSRKLIENSRRIKKKVLHIYKVIGDNFSKNKVFPLALDYIERVLQIEPGNIDALYSRGSIFLAQGELDKALEDYNRVIELNPQEARAFGSRGRIYVTKKEYGQALTDYSRAIELRIQDAEIYYKRGMIYHSQAEYDKALSDYNRALEIEPENAWIYSHRGNIYHIKGDYDKAIVDCSLAIELDLETSDVYIVRGNSYQAEGDHANAIADYNRTLELNPQAHRVYYYRGDSHHARGEHEKALSDYERAIELDPGYAETRDNRGNAYEVKKECEIELLEISQTIKADPEDAGLYYNRGNVYDALGEYDKALLDFNEAIELAPEDPDFFSIRGTLFHNKGDFKRALVDYNWAIELDAEDASLFYNRGNTYDALKEHEKALDDYGRAIELDPENADAYNNRGTINYLKGNYKKALLDYTHAIELNPEDAGAYYNRGNTYDALKEFDNALADYKKTITIDPMESTAYLLIAQVYIVSNNFPEALKTIEQALTLNLETDEKAYGLYFEFIVRNMLDIEAGECEVELNAILKKDFTCTWTFDSIESWFERIEIPVEKKNAITAKTGLLKNHKTKK